MNPKFYAKRNEFAPYGIELEKQQIFMAYIKNFKPDTRLEITVKKYVPKRTDRQHRYYFGVVVDMIARETGMSKEEAHDGLKQMFLRVDHDKLPTVRSTTSLTTKEFMAYIEQVVMWSAQFLGLVIPDPDYVDF